MPNRSQTSTHGDRESLRGHPPGGLSALDAPSLLAALMAESPEFGDSLQITLKILPLPVLPPGAAAAAAKPSQAQAGAAMATSPAAIVVGSAHVRSVRLQLRAGGFDGLVRFVLPSDPLLAGSDALVPLLDAKELLQVELVATPRLPEATPSQGATVTAKPTVSPLGPPPPQSFRLMGLVLDSSYVETISEVAKNEPVLFRLYTLRLADPAQVLWRQHRPCDLYVNKSLRDVIDRYVGQHIRVEYLDQTLATVEPLLCTGLGFEHDETTSFYDFVMFALLMFDASWLYQYQKGTYQVVGPKQPLLALLSRQVAAARIVPPVPPAAQHAVGQSQPAAAPQGTPTEQRLVEPTTSISPKGQQAGAVKAKSSVQPAARGPILPPGAPITLRPKEIVRISIYQPQSSRHQRAVLNAFAHSPRRYRVANKLAQSELRRDVLIRTMSQQELEQRVVAEAQRDTPATATLLLHFVSFPTSPFTPGGLYDFGVDPGLWAMENLAVPSAAVAGPCRVIQVDFCAEAQQLELRVGAAALAPVAYCCQLSAQLQPAATASSSRPPFATPSFPTVVEGIVLGIAPLGGATAQGGTVQSSAHTSAAQPDLTYQHHPDPSTQEPRYQVRLPAFDGQVVMAAQRPLDTQGVSWLPLQNGQRVLVELGFRSAVISGVLDPRPGVPLPQAAQGDALLLGRGAGRAVALQQWFSAEQPQFELSLRHDQGRERLFLRPGQFQLYVGSTAQLALASGTSTGGATSAVTQTGVTQTGATQTGATQTGATQTGATQASATQATLSQAGLMGSQPFFGGVDAAPPYQPVTVATQPSTPSLLASTTAAQVEGGAAASTQGGAAVSTQGGAATSTQGGAAVSTQGGAAASTQVQSALTSSALFASDTAARVAEQTRRVTTPLYATFTIEQDSGVTITISDARSRTTQTLRLNGQQLHSRVEGAVQSSVFVQTADTVAISAGRFIVEADELRLFGERDVLLLSPKNVTAQAGVALQLQSAGDISQLATQAVDIAGLRLTASAMDRLTLSGGASGVGVLGLSGVDIFGTNINLTGVSTNITGLAAALTATSTSIGSPPPPPPPPAVSASTTASAGTQASQAGTQASQAGTQASQVGSQASQVGSQASQVGSQASQVGSQASQVGSQASQVGTQASQVGTQASQVGTQAAQVGTQLATAGGAASSIGGSASGTAISTGSAGSSIAAPPPLFAGMSPGDTAGLAAGVAAIAAKTGIVPPGLPPPPPPPPPLQSTAAQSQGSAGQLVSGTAASSQTTAATAVPVIPPDAGSAKLTPIDLLQRFALVRAPFFPSPLPPQPLVPPGSLQALAQGSIPPADPNAEAPFARLTQLLSAKLTPAPSPSTAGFAQGTSAQGASAQGASAQQRISAQQGTSAQGTSAQGTSAQGTSAQGASAQGASAQGASAQGASAQGASAQQGASVQGASAQGASAQGASAQGASAQRGASTQGASAQGISAQGSSALGTSAQSTSALGMSAQVTSAQSASALGTPAQTTSALGTTKNG